MHIFTYLPTYLLILLYVAVFSTGVAHQRPESYPPREEVSRSHSEKSPAKNHRVFRASDLVVGEVLGRGFYGQAVKVNSVN